MIPVVVPVCLPMTTRLAAGTRSAARALIVANTVVVTIHIPATRSMMLAAHVAISVVVYIHVLRASSVASITTIAHAIAISITNKCFDEYEYQLVQDVVMTRFV